MFSRLTSQSKPAARTASQPTSGSGGASARVRHDLATTRWGPERGTECDVRGLPNQIGGGEPRASEHVGQHATPARIEVESAPCHYTLQPQEVVEYTVVESSLCTANHTRERLRRWRASHSDRRANSRERVHAWLGAWREVRQPLTGASTDACTTRQVLKISVVQPADDDSESAVVDRAQALRPARWVAHEAAQRDLVMRPVEGLAGHGVPRHPCRAVQVHAVSVRGIRAMALLLCCTARAIQWQHGGRLMVPLSRGAVYQPGKQARGCFQRALQRSGRPSEVGGLDARAGAEWRPGESVRWWEHHAHRAWNVAGGAGRQRGRQRSAEKRGAKGRRLKVHGVPEVCRL